MRNTFVKQHADHWTTSLHGSKVSMEMEDGQELTLYDVYHDMYETDRSFFNSIRFFDANQRSSLVSQYLRNTNLALSILRTYENLQARNPPTRMVLNIPLNISDISGNSTHSFFDPVPVTPTPQQIRDAVDSHVNIPDTTCSICQEPVNCATRIRGCGHCFHGHCIQQWFSMNPRCPMCRFDIRDSVTTGTVSGGGGRSYSIIHDVSGNRLHDVSGNRYNSNAH